MKRIFKRLASATGVVSSRPNAFSGRCCLEGDKVVGAEIPATGEWKNQNGKF